MSETRATLGKVVVLTGNFRSHGVKALLGRSLVAYNVPSKSINSTLGTAVVAFRQTASINVTQARVLAAIRGKTENPKLTAWTFTLDGHAFYVLRLGDGKTLVYDLSTEQWSWWTSETSIRWRASTGMNWRSSGDVAHAFGSNVIVGDDTYGHLWFLDPEQGYDNSTNIVDMNPVSFPRVATGQMIARTRKPVPVYEVYLTASGGYPQTVAPTVELSYSDDVGNTYVTAGTYTVEDGNYGQEFAWRSLGLVYPPGRLFRITDTGAFARIDGLDISDGTGAS